MDDVRFRAATADDCRLIFQWANDPETRANSARPEPIPWESHVDWYMRRMADPKAETWIAMDEEDTPIGQVRFDDAGGEVEIGVMVASDRRGGGVGTRMIEQATDDFLRRWKGAPVVAYVRHHNTASQRAFVKAGYEPDGEGEARGVTMLRYVRRGAASSSDSAPG